MQDYKDVQSAGSEGSHSKLISLTADDSILWTVKYDVDEPGSVLTFAGFTESEIDTLLVKTKAPTIDDTKARVWAVEKELEHLQHKVEVLRKSMEDLIVLLMKQ